MEYPYNDIKQFSITDANGNELKAVIKDDSIIVYWPPLQDIPEIVTPKITVSDLASLSPASEQQVSFTSETVYTVIAQDESVKTYTLIPIINQPEPWVEINQRDAAIYRLNSQSLRIGGEYIIPNSEETNVFLIDSVSKKEFKIDLENATIFTYNAIIVSIPAYQEIDPGRYYVKVTTGTYTKTTEPYSLLPPIGGTDLIQSLQLDQQGQQIKQGDELSFTYSLTGPAAKYYIGNFTYAVITDMFGVTIATANISEQTETSLKLQLPDDIPTGLLGTIYLYNSANINGSTPVILSQWYADYITGIIAK
ncbi:hypothetical protein DN748_14270 [Sinomicrobium soli]|nr:hypothetical protein DN748_14270 [Sinomicrobium sp. N-1-3-6]